MMAIVLHQLYIHLKLAIVPTVKFLSCVLPHFPAENMWNSSSSVKSSKKGTKYNSHNSLAAGCYLLLSAAVLVPCHCLYNFKVYSLFGKAKSRYCQ
jgi:hypothetical protein